VAETKDMGQLLEHARESYDIPFSVPISTSEFQPSDVPGFKMMELKIGTPPHSRKARLFVSKDERYYILGKFRDLQTHPDHDRLKSMDLSRSPARGRKSAPVTIVEFTDYQCLFCRRGYGIMQDEILKEYSSKIRWIYKSFPLRSIHPWAESAAVAAECVKRQSVSKFWRFHGRIFENQETLTMDNANDTLAGFAREAGVKMKKFDSCFEKRDTLKTVQKDIAEGEKLGVSGTPAYFVNGHPVRGADAAALKRTIEEALQGKHGRGKEYDTGN